MAIDYNEEDLLVQMNNEFRAAVLPVTVIVGIEVFMAFFGNLLVLYIFKFRYHHCTYRYFVLCLAVIDFISSLTTMPGEMVTQLYWYNYPVPKVCKAKSFFNVFTVAGEALCLMAIAVQRYLKVCKPNGIQIQPNIAKLFCGIIYLCAIILAIPVAIYWGTHDENKPYHYQNTTVNITVTKCEIDARYEDTNHPLHYSVSIEVILSMTLVFMFVLYCFIIRTLVQYRTNERSIAVDPRVVRKTWIMFILTIAFIITTILYFTLLSLIADKFLTELSDGEKAVYFLFFRLYFINHVINPIVYGIMDAEFRTHLKDIKDAIIGKNN